MAHIGGQVYTSLKEAIKYSTGDYGLVATYQAPDGKLVYFINGRPTITIGAPKKET